MRRYGTLDNALMAAGGRPSGFDYMRLILAVSVLCSHSVSSSYGHAAAEALWDSPARPFLRAILPMFFALSGFLVAGSMARCHSLVKFLGLRFIRIYPALTVEVLLSAILIGPFVTTVPLADYFASDVFAQYLVNVTGHISFFLPGVFETNPVPRVVNGQLWTVPFELLCYIALTGLIVIGAKRFRVLIPLGSVAVVLAFILREGHKAGGVPEEFYRALGGPLLVAAFLAGVTLYTYRDRIPYSFGLFLAACVVSIVGLGVVPHGAYLGIFAVSYVTAYLGLTNFPKIRMIKHADYSYGIFLYGFVVQQLVVYALPSAREWYWNIAISLPLTAIIAAASWHWIEKPALALKWLLDSYERKFTRTPKAA